MAFGWLHAIVACMTLATGTPQDDVIEARIPIKNTSPERVMSVFREDRSLMRLGSFSIRYEGDGSGEVIVKGKPGSVEKIREVIRLLDVVPKRVALEVRLIRLTKEEGKVVEEALADLKTLASNDRPFTVTGTDAIWESEAKLHPRVNGDGTVSVRLWFTQSIGARKSDFKSLARRMRLGETFGVTYLNDFGNLTVADWESERQRPFRKQAYRVEAKLVEVK